MWFSYFMHYFSKLIFFSLPYTACYFLLNKLLTESVLRKKILINFNYIAQVYLAVSYSVHNVQCGQLLLIFIVFVGVNFVLTWLIYKPDDLPEQDDGHLVYSFFMSIIGCIMSSVLCVYDQVQEYARARKEIEDVITEEVNIKYGRINAARFSSTVTQAHKDAIKALDNDLWIKEAISPIMNLHVLFDKVSEKNAPMSSTRLTGRSARVSIITLNGSVDIGQALIDAIMTASRYPQKATKWVRLKAYLYYWFREKSFIGDAIEKKIEELIIGLN